MNVFKKLWTRIKKEKKPQESSWYNNAHEQEKDRWRVPSEGGCGTGSGHMDYSITRQIAKK